MFLESLAVVLCTAAVTTVVFQRLRQPVVLGYLIAGLIVGPHVPVRLVADTHVVETLSELGVILLMFSLGLEFSLKKLARVARTGGLVALIEVSLMLSFGYVLGRAFGWGARESTFVGAVIAISSTTIIVKTFNELKVDPRIKERVFGILIAEDVLAILLVTTLTAVSTGAGLSPKVLAYTAGRLVLFLVTVVVLGMFVVPRLMRLVVKLNRPETTVVASVGLCFALALFAKEVGYSVALGAFLAGTLVSESGRSKPIEKLVEPVRDVFAAIFFVSVGMLLDPRIVIQQWPVVLVLSLAVIGGKVFAVSIGSFLSGASIREATQAGMTLAQIGEFSFIIAGVGLSLGASERSLYPVAVVVSAFTTLTTPWLVKASARVGERLDRVMPHRLQVFATVYSAWVASLGASRHAPGFWSAFRRLARLILLDAVLLVAIVIATSLSLDGVATILESMTGIRLAITRGLVVAGAMVASVPFIVGIIRCARSLGHLIARGSIEPGDEPPAALLVAIQIGMVLVIGAPILALTSAFLPTNAGPLVLACIVAAMVFLFWRSASDLQTQVRAGVEVVIDALAKQGQADHRDDTGDLDIAVQTAMPWIGSIQSIELSPRSDAVGRTLAQINLRGRTGANVVAIRRGASVLVPGPDDELLGGDVLAMTGSPTAVKAAELVLSAPGSASDTRTEIAIERK